MIRLLTILVLAYGLIILLVYLAQARLLYFPLRDLAGTPRDLGLAYEEVELTADDGVRLHAWFVPAPHARGTVLHMHGNGGNISHRLDRIALFHRLGLNVLLFDYRGYGRSEGSPSQEGIYRDANAAWRYLIEHRKLPPSAILLHGESLGGAVASWLATREQPAALIIESGFTSATDLGAEVYPWLPVRWIGRHPYPSKIHLTRVRAPVLIVHSRHDEIIPFHHGQALYAAANEPKQLLEIQGGHNDGFLISGDRYLGGIEAFLQSVSPVPVSTRLGTR